MKECVSTVINIIRNTTDMIYYFPKQLTRVVFFPGGLLSGVGIFSGLLTGGLLSVIRNLYRLLLESTH